MAILISNARHMFQVFSARSKYYMNVTVGGVALYDVTVTLTSEEVELFRKDDNLAIALAADIATRTSAYEGRLVHPAIVPF